MEFVFYFSAFFSMLLTLCVIIHRNPIYALLYFVLSLFAISCSFFALGSYFAGSLEVIIYAGAVMVLFIFSLMLMNPSAIQHKYNIIIFDWFFYLSCVVSLLLIITLIYGIYSMRYCYIHSQIVSTKDIGIFLFGPYILIVEMISILLLGSLVVSFHFGRDE